MSLWSDMMKKSSNKDVLVNQKNNKKIIKKKKVINSENSEYINIKTYGLKNVDEEFDYKYTDSIGDIIVEFRDLFSNYKAYDISNKFGSNLYNFIKYHSNNYDRLIETVEKYNDKIEEELEKELEKEEEENRYY